MSKEHSEKKKQINIAAAVIAAVLVICLCTVFVMGKKAPGKSETEAVSGAGTAEAETTQEPVDWDSLDKVTLNQHKYGLLHKVTTWLILGTDASGNEKGTGEAYQGAMADFLMLVVFDEENKTYGAIQLNRDTMTEVSLIDKQGEGEATAEIQLCTAHWYGGSRQQNCENTVKAVSKLLGGIPIDGYYEMPMDTIPLLNKQAGGVKVKLLEDFSSVDPKMKKGRKMILNDTQAYHYIHDRYGVGDEENTSRMKGQRQYLGSLVKKIKKQAASDKKGSSAIIRSSRFLYISIWLLATACHTDHTLFVLSFLICCWFPQQNHYCNHMLRHFQQHLYHDLILQQNSLVA